MNGRPWWMLLQIGGWLTLMTLVMGWLGRSRLRARPSEEARVLVNPASMLGLSGVTVLLFGGIAVAANVLEVEGPPIHWLGTAIPVAFALLGLPGLAAYLLEEYRVSESGISGRNLVGSARRLEWSELRSVRYAPVMKWFRLETRSGNVMRVSAMLMGLQEFARLCLQHAPQGVIDAETRDLLRATAAGEPPTLWS